MGNLSLFSKIRGIGRDSRKERAMVPVTSALEIELTDEELATIRGGHGHDDDDDHWHRRRRWWRHDGWGHGGWHGDDDDQLLIIGIIIPDFGTNERCLLFMAPLLYIDFL